MTQAPSPTPGTISKEKFCELTGKTDRRLRQLADEGKFPPPVRGRWQADVCIRGFIRHQEELIIKKSDSAKAAEQRLKNAKADIAEDERDRGRKLYVLKSEIGPALRNVSMHQRAVLQRKFENELGPKLAGRKTPEILALIKGSVDDVCQIFQEGVGNWMETARETPSSKKKGKDGDAVESVLTGTAK